MRPAARPTFAFALSAALAIGCTAKAPPAENAPVASGEIKATPDETKAAAGEKTVAPAATPATPDVPRPPLDCGAIDDAAPLFEKPSLLLIGETHGTREIPAAVGELACLAGAKRPVRIGLELSRADQPRIDRFMASDGGPAARDALTDSQPWRWEFQDGRTSRAMVDLVDRARRLKAAGRDVKVFGYDVVTFDGESTRDAGMAEHIAAARKAEPDATFIVLSGNRHTQVQTERAPPGEPAFVPMGAQLAKTFDDVVALAARTSGGRYWACVGPDPSACGPQERAAKDHGRPGVYVDRETKPIPPGHHGVLHVGKTTISPPARRGSDPAADP